MYVGGPEFCTGVLEQTLGWSPKGTWFVCLCMCKCLLCNMGFLVAFIEAKVNTGTKTHKQAQGNKLAYY